MTSEVTHVGASKCHGLNFMRQICSICLASTEGAALDIRRRFRMAARHLLSLSLILACGLMLCSQARASATYSFKSGPPTAYNSNDGSSFTLDFTTPTQLADGIYQWGTDNLGQSNTHLPAGVTFKFTDGYTTLTDPADLSPAFQFQITGGTINQTNGLLGMYAEDTAHYDPYYGYNYFYIGDAGYSQLQDSLNPTIVGLNYEDHHIPVAGGQNGTWSYSFIASVPEPAAGSLLALGLAMLVVMRRRLCS